MGKYGKEDAIRDNAAILHRKRVKEIEDMMRKDSINEFHLSPEDEKTEIDPGTAEANEIRDNIRARFDSISHVKEYYPANDEKLWREYYMSSFGKTVYWYRKYNKEGKIVTEWVAKEETIENELGRPEEKIRALEKKEIVKPLWGESERRYVEVYSKAHDWLLTESYFVIGAVKDGEHRQYLVRGKEKGGRIGTIVSITNMVAGKRHGMESFYRRDNTRRISLTRTWENDELVEETRYNLKGEVIESKEYNGKIGTHTTYKDGKTLMTEKYVDDEKVEHIIYDGTSKIVWQRNDDKTEKYTRYDGGREVETSKYVDGKVSNYSACGGALTMNFGPNTKIIKRKL